MTKILYQIFLFFRRCRWHRWISLQIFEKIWSGPNGILKGPGDTHLWKNTWSQKSRIRLPLNSSWEPQGRTLRGKALQMKALWVKVLRMKLVRVRVLWVKPLLVKALWRKALWTKALWAKVLWGTVRWGSEPNTIIKGRQLPHVLHSVD